MPLNISYYETEDGYLLRKIDGYGQTALDGYLLNGGEAQKTWDPSWWRFVCPKTETPVLEGPVWFENKPLYWERLEGTPVSFPERLEYEAGTTAADNLYRLVTEKVNRGRKVQDCTFTRLGEIVWSNLEKPEEFSFKLAKESSWSGDSAERSLEIKDIFSSNIWAESFIQVADIQRAMTPSFAWHLGPCTLPSHIFYRVVRAWVKENLNGKYATITSDYDFVFEVKKILPCKPHEVKYTRPFGRTKRERSKVYVQLEKDRKVSVFHITHKQKVHGTEYGAKILPDIAGTSLNDLLENIKAYLDETMAMINAPLQICSHCDGSGITEDQ